MKRARYVVILAAALAVTFSGCMHINRPNVPPVVDSTGTYSANLFNADYEAYKSAVNPKDGSAPDLAKARLLRNQMVNRVEVDIEKGYRNFEQSLTTTRAGIQTGGDVVELGLSAAIGVVGAVEVKDLLAASLTGFKGTRLSFDKNVFREKTTEILISRMQGARDAVRNRITQKMSDMDVGAYPFEEAWRDLVEYFYAGTLPVALQQLANDAGQSAIEAQKKATDIDVKRANTAAEAQMAVRVRTKYAEWAHMAEKAETKASAVKQLQDILTSLGDAEHAKSTDPNELLTALRVQMQAAVSDPEKLKLFEKLLTPAQQ
jgi:hypothetical protein